MKIYLNDQEANFELKGEKILGEVLDGLEKWVREQKHFLGSIRVNKEEIDPNENSVRARPLREIKTLHCEILSAVAYAVWVWSDIRLHLEPFNQISTQMVSEKMGEISGRLEWIKKVITKLNSFFENPDESLNLIQQIKTLELLVFQLKDQPKNLKKIFDLLKLIDRELEQGIFKLNLKILKVGLKEDRDSLRNSIENYLGFLDFMEEKILQTAVSFQKAHLKLVLKELPIVVESLGVFFIINRQITSHHQDIEEDKVARDELEKLLEGHLHGLEEALKKQDYIEVADILEYEIKEMIPAMKELLEKVFTHFVSELESSI